ncbi:cell division protein FtsA [Candidatus Saccharibacteria bacterium]|nr:cell division protein FtsA [Candidatus Saccharibacteria bacterium]
MQENSRYAVGIDIGTTTVRCVVGHIDTVSGSATIVGAGEAPNKGMRKGIVSHLNGPAQAIDTALGDAEKISGYQIDDASVSINGAHISGVVAEGMIAVGAIDHEVDEADVRRLEEVATTGKLPANREILEVVPHSFRLDGQDNIKDPVGMTGTRLELNAYVVSALLPHLNNLEKTLDIAKVRPTQIQPSVLTAAKAVLSEQQIENGVAVLEMGGTTTGLAIFEEGDLQYISVLPVGGVNITNDLAIGLKVDPEVAEKIKLKYAYATLGDDEQPDEILKITVDKETHQFSRRDVDDIVGARLEELFEAVQKELKQAGKAGQLPNGIVLTGAAAQLTGMVEFVKEQLGVAARVGKVRNVSAVSEQANGPAYAAAIGLMLLDADAPQKQSRKVASKETFSQSKDKSVQAAKKASGFVKSLMDKFKQ